MGGDSPRWLNQNLGATTRAATQTASAHAFFGHLYFQAAEAMPTRLFALNWESMIIDQEW